MAARRPAVWAGLAVPGDDHGSYGNCVIIKHNDHISTLYAHMDDQIHPLEVRVGDVVQQGQVIGYEGMTGWTTGPHLHFEVRVDNIQVDPLLLIPNPES
ncbi:MAG: M23 family metallopeptidase [Chloroflexi bacterium]|nr:M23 family metallopeptidase [Chloroflexota bacterium]